MKRALAALAPIVLVAAVVRVFGQGQLRLSLAVLEAILQGATPLLLCGLAVALGFRAGVFNLGGEGQLVIGAVAATAVGVHAPAWTFWTFPAVLVAGALAGLGWAALAAWLKRARGAPEVLSTILLNFVALQLSRYLIDYGNLLNEARHAYPMSDEVTPAAQLAPLHLGALELPPSILGAALLALALDLALARTRAGFELRLTGASPTVARAQGFSPGRAVWTAFLAGGALAGLAGALSVASVTHRLYWSPSTGTGYTAVAVALVADLRPRAVVPAALAFAALEAGAQAAERQFAVPHATAAGIEGLLVLAVIAQRALVAGRSAA